MKGECNPSPSRPWWVATKSYTARCANGSIGAPSTATRQATSCLSLADAETKARDAAKLAAEAGLSCVWTSTQSWQKKCLDDRFVIQTRTATSTVSQIHADSEARALAKAACDALLDCSVPTQDDEPVDAPWVQSNDELPEAEEGYEWRPYCQRKLNYTRSAGGSWNLTGAFRVRDNAETLEGLSSFWWRIPTDDLDAMLATAEGDFSEMTISVSLTFDMMRQRRRLKPRIAIGDETDSVGKLIEIIVTPM